MSSDVKDKPLVSVLMTAYNREAYIGEAIESVLASTYSHFELIIVDDTSEDNTVAIVQKYAATDKRIQLHINEKNLGDYPNRNRAASFAKGKYLKYLDSDDKILDFGLEYCVAEMEKYPEAALGLVVLYDMHAGASVCVPPEKMVRDHFFKTHNLTIGPTGTIIRRDKFEFMHGFDTRFALASDCFFNIGMAAIYPVVLLQKMFVYYREHEGQQKNNNVNYLIYGHLYFKELMEKVKLPLTKKEINYLYQKMFKRHSVNLTRFLLDTGDFTTVRKVMEKTGFSFYDYIRGFLK